VQSYPERFFFVEKERQLIQSLQTNHIDVFFADKLQMELLLWKSGFHASIKPSDIQLQPENFYILMSKKTISPAFVAWFNQRLVTTFKQTAQYSSLVRGYSVPIFIRMLTSTTFY
jgi:ABC-type amino acid transport substrate-binding protein